jgi:hypothetical protein
MAESAGLERTLASENTRRDGALSVGPTSLNIHDQDDVVSSLNGGREGGLLSEFCWFQVPNTDR